MTEFDSHSVGYVLALVSSESGCIITWFTSVSILSSVNLIFILSSEREYKTVSWTDFSLCGKIESIHSENKISLVTDSIHLSRL